MHSKANHFELDLNFFRYYIQRKMVLLVHLPTRY